MNTRSSASSKGKKAVCIGIAIAMSLLFFAVLLGILYLTPLWGENTHLKLTIAGNGMLFAEILFIGCCVKLRENVRQGNLFLAASALEFLLIFVSGIMSILDGIPWAGRLLFALLTFSTLLVIAVNLLFWFYQCDSMPPNPSRRYFTQGICALFLAYAVLLAVNCFTGILFYVDAEGWMWLPGIGIMTAFMTAFYLLYLLYALLQRCSLKKKIAFVSFAVFPMLLAAITTAWSWAGVETTEFTSTYIFQLLAAYVVFLCDYTEDQELFLRQKAELSEQARARTELQTALMLSQIRPHFLYNALTAIRNLCKNDPAEAYNALGLFSDYLRGNMDGLGDGRIIPFEKELEHIKTYLMLEQMRFGDELRVEYDIRYRDFSLPALTVQPIVENAVRHGAIMNEDGGVVTIRAERADGGAVITVTDNGPGFDPAVPPADGRRHLGLQNVRECLAASGCGELRLDSAVGAGTTATIYIREDET